MRIQDEKSREWRKMMELKERLTVVAPTKDNVNLTVVQEVGVKPPFASQPCVCGNQRGIYVGGLVTDSFVPCIVSYRSRQPDSNCEVIEPFGSVVQAIAAIGNYLYVGDGSAIAEDCIHVTQKAILRCITATCDVETLSITDSRAISLPCGGLTCIQYQPSTRRLLTGSTDGIVCVLSLECPESPNFASHFQVQLPESRSVASMAFCGSVVAVGLSSPFVLLHAIESGTCVNELSGQHGDVLCLCSDETAAHDSDSSLQGKGGSLLYSGASDGSIKVWRMETFRPVGSMLEQRGRLTVLAYLSKMQWLVAGGQDGMLRVWDRSYKCIFRNALFPAAICALSVTGTSNLLAMDVNGTIKSISLSPE